MTVVLAISSYREDGAVLELLSQIDRPSARALFERVLIVDSLGQGAVPDEIARRGLEDWIDYHNAEHNLGAAGNLDRRLHEAAALGADWMFALNHDGELRLEVVERLLTTAKTHSLGAAYPVRRIAPDRFDLTGSRPFPWRTRRRRTDRLPRTKTLRAFWSSSNGALYSVEPYRRGVRPPVELWHGWEDLAYGRLLHRAGFEQLICIDTPLESRYDFEVKTIAGRRSLIASKPPWMNYYFARNLMLVASRSTPGGSALLGTIVRIATELLATALLRRDKLARWRFTGRGAWDGLLGRGGMRVHPNLEPTDSVGPSSGRPPSNPI